MAPVDAQCTVENRAESPSRLAPVFEPPQGLPRSAEFRLRRKGRLRGSRDFARLEDYREFVTRVVAAANAPRATALVAKIPPSAGSPRTTSESYHPTASCRHFKEASARQHTASTHS